MSILKRYHQEKVTSSMPFIDRFQIFARRLYISMFNNVNFTLCILLFLSGYLNAQEQNRNLRKQKYVIVEECTVIIDVHTLVPHDIIVTHKSDTLYQYQIQNNLLTLDSTLCQSIIGDTLRIQYRTFGYNFEKKYFTIDSSFLEYKEKEASYEYNLNNKSFDIINAKGLEYRGSFSRGFSVGNAQSLVLNSNFDMQLVGDLGNDLKIVAAISDDNLPIQAQGTTQQLQEFDKVFIQVSKGSTVLTAGDYELRKPEGYFMNYFKKLKGLSIGTTQNIKNNAQIYTKGSFAISRGKFARQSLPTREGNQGPYRLNGNNGERFIIVLAGTEKVYFNGILLTRGFDHDYIIDYNRAEIIFSPIRAVARDSRVLIEFEYTDVSYLRSLYATETRIISGKWRANLNYYSEQDSRVSTGEVSLDSIDIGILSSSGNNIDRAVRSGIIEASQELSEVTNRILYAGIPNPMNPEEIILRFTENLDSARYTAIFTEVGPGKGDYIIDTKIIRNARVYQFVGNKQGNYQPIIRLVPPEQRQMITLNSQYTHNKNTQIYAETSLSHFDINRFSSIGNSDNVGYASHFRAQHKISLDTAGKYILGAQIRHEYLHKHFKSLNPFRPQEFIRDWNLEQIIQEGDESLLHTTLNLQHQQGWSVKYMYNRFDKKDAYNGFKNEGEVKYSSKRWNITSFANFLESKSAIADKSSQFLRPNTTIEYKLFKKNDWWLGYFYDGEKNKIRSLNSDTLTKQSYAFNMHKWYLHSLKDGKFLLRLAYSIRDDYFAKSNNMNLASLANEYELVGKWIASSNSQLQWSIIGRDLRILDTQLLPNDNSKKSILGKLDYNFTLWNNGIKSTTSYNTTSGQEPKVEYVFVKVETGRGDYFCVTNCDNPNLTNILDFRYDPSNPLSSYIRLTLINNEFIRTNNLEFNQNFTVEPAKIFKHLKKEKTKSILSKFSTLSNIRMIKKQMDDGNNAFSSFYNLSTKDTSLVSYNAMTNHTLFFNKGNIKNDGQIGYRDSKNRILQLSGPEDRSVEDIFIRWRQSVWDRADLILYTEASNKKYNSAVAPERNLDIQIYRAKPELSIRPTNNTRIISRYTYQYKIQNILTLDEAIFHEFSIEGAFRKSNKWSLDGNISWVDINYSGTPNSPLEYDMLDGLKDGTNFLWNVLLTRRMANNIDLTMNYEGRKTGLIPIIHVGKVQVKATF